MQTLSLKFETGHLYLAIDGVEWMFDTGSPTSFGAVDSIVLDGEAFKIPSSYMGMDAEKLSGFANHPTCGLIGSDVINRFDVRLDVDSGEMILSDRKSVV